MSKLFAWLVGKSLISFICNFIYDFINFWIVFSYFLILCIFKMLSYYVFWYCCMIFMMMMNYFSQLVVEGATVSLFSLDKCFIMYLVYEYIELWMFLNWFSKIVEMLIFECSIYFEIWVVFLHYIRWNRLWSVAHRKQIWILSTLLPSRRISYFNRNFFTRSLKEHERSIWSFERFCDMMSRD